MPNELLCFSIFIWDVHPPRALSGLKVVIMRFYWDARKYEKYLWLYFWLKKERKIRWEEERKIGREEERGGISIACPQANCRRIFFGWFWTELKRTFHPFIEQSHRQKAKNCWVVDVPVVVNRSFPSQFRSLRTDMPMKAVIFSPAICVLNNDMLFFLLVLVFPSITQSIHAHLAEPQLAVFTRVHNHFTHIFVPHVFRTELRVLVGFDLRLGAADNNRLSGSAMCVCVAWLCRGAVYLCSDRFIGSFCVIL